MSVSRTFQAACEIRSALSSAVIDVWVVQEEHRCPCGSVCEFCRVGVLGDEAPGIEKLAIEHQGDEGSSGRYVSEG